MLVKYVIHRIGTPKIAFKGHWTEYQAEYWNNVFGWSYKWESTVFDDKNYNLPEEGEWIEIYVEEKDEDNAQVI